MRVVRNRHALSLSLPCHCLQCFAGQSRHAHIIAQMFDLLHRQRLFGALRKARRSVVQRPQELHLHHVGTVALLVIHP